MKLFITVLIASLTFFSCKKNSPLPDELPPAGNNVYISGSVNQPSDGSSRPCYWKNGTRVDLEIPVGYGAAGSIAAAANGDIYILGSYNNNGVFKYCYWKNGTRTDVQPIAGFNQASISKIFISGNDIYLAGVCSNTYPPVALCYWKNGTPVQIADVIDANERSLITSIFVSGSDVYLTGYCGQYGNVQTASMWKNGVRSNLNFTGSGKWSMGADLNVNGGNVYAGGFAYNDANTVKTAVYWINGLGVFVGLTNGDSEIRDIDVVNGTVHSAGTFKNNYGYQGPCYWKNAALTPLPGLNNDAGFANGLLVSGGDIYIAGRVYASNGSNRPVFWKNGLLTELSLLDNTKGGSAADVYIGR